MKFGIRMPSLKRRFAARTSLKRVIRHSLGLKMPRGTGFLTNPKKAIYNAVYNRTSVSVDNLVKQPSSGKSGNQSENVELRLRARADGNVMCPKCEVDLGFHYTNLKLNFDYKCYACGMVIKIKQFNPAPGIIPNSVSEEDDR